LTVSSAIADGADPGATAARRRWPVSRMLIYGALIAVAAVYLLPALIVVLNVFRNSADVARDGVIAFPERFSLDAFGKVWNEACVSGTCAGIKANFYNSLKIVIPSTIITTALGAVNGFILAKWKIRGANFILLVMVVGVFMPFQTSLLPWAIILSWLGLYNSFYGLILIDCVQGISFATLFCAAYFRRIPDDIVKAARIDGAGFWRIFWKIILPLSPPIIIVTVIWQFTGIWNEFLYGVVFTSGRQQPVTAAIIAVSQSGLQVRDIAVSSTMVLYGALPPLLVYFFGGRYFIRGLTQGAIK
jgi:glucose/mannose transport system permease protein